MSEAAALQQPSKRERNRTEKRTMALDAALTVFAKFGYSAATMDAIAVEAGLSKPTLYHYFPSKDELFREMMLAPRTQMISVFEHSAGDCHVAKLLEFSRVYAETVMHPDFLSLARLVIGDAQRYPDLGRHYQSSGPDRVLKGLSGFMTAQSSRGKLEIEDAELAAEDFWGLILSAPRNRALHVPDEVPGKRQLDKYINNGIKVFLKAYSTDPTTDLSRLAELIKPAKVKPTRASKTL